MAIIELNIIDDINDGIIKFEAAEVRMGAFQGLPSGRGDFVESPEFTCFGHRWALRVFPGGYADSDDGSVGVYLFHVSGGTIEVRGSFAVKRSSAEIAAHGDIERRVFQPRGTRGGGDTWGLPNFTRRSTIVAALQGGALVIEVRLTKTRPSELPPAPFIPENPLSKHILEKFMDEKSADVVFEVGGEQAGTAGKATFHAHSFILEGWSSTLAELCNSAEPVHIPNVEPTIFRQMLYHMYGGKVFDGDHSFPGRCKELIGAADRFGIASLKLEAEAEFVTSTAFAFDNVVETLLYADALNCALLKEAAMDFLVENGNEAARKLSFAEVPGSMIPDLLAAMNRGRGGGSAGTSTCDFGAMGVSDLRKRLHKKGLDIDGSRESMIALLEAHSSN